MGTIKEDTKISFMHCSICKKEFKESDSMPFCSTRCREVDLGRWLSEKYGLIHVKDEEEEEELNEE